MNAFQSYNGQPYCGDKYSYNQYQQRDEPYHRDPRNQYQQRDEPYRRDTRNQYQQRDEQYRGDPRNQYQQRDEPYRGQQQQKDRLHSDPQSRDRNESYHGQQQQRDRPRDSQSHDQHQYLDKLYQSRSGKEEHFPFKYDKNGKYGKYTFGQQIELYIEEQERLDQVNLNRELRKKEYEDLDPDLRLEYEEIDRQMERFGDHASRLREGEFILTNKECEFLYKK